MAPRLPPRGREGGSKVFVNLGEGKGERLVVHASFVIRSTIRGSAMLATASSTR